MYCRDHRARLGVDEAAMPEEPGAATLVLSSKATTMHSHEMIEPKEGIDDAASFMSASTATDAMAALKLPRLDELSQCGEPFECPICFTLQSIKRDRTWQ